MRTSRALRSKLLLDPGMGRNFLGFFLLAILIQGVLYAVLGEIGIYAAIGILGAMFALFAIQYPVLVLYLVLVVSVFVSALQEFSLSVGSTQLRLSGALWILIALIVVASLLVRIRWIRVRAYLWPFLVFQLWAAVRWILAPSGFLGLKDLLWYSMPALFGFFMPVVLKREQQSATYIRLFERLLLFSVFGPILLYTFALTSGLAEMTWRGPRGVLVGSARGVPLYLLIVLSVALASWRYASSKQKGVLFGYITMGTILFSLGRMASVLALTLFAIRRVSLRHKWSLLIRWGLAVLLVVVILIQIPVFRQRFFIQSNWSLSDGLGGINTAGRSRMWTVAFYSALDSPIIGRGLGSARVKVAQEVFADDDDITEYHPHNEYLQAFHDLGLIGLGLLGIAWGLLLMRTWRQWEHASSPIAAQWSMAATLSISVVLISSLTDNTLHYPFVVVPTFIIVGIADHFSRLDSLGQILR